MVLLAGCPTTVGKPFKPQPVQPFEHNQKYLVGVLNMADVSGDASADAPLVSVAAGEILASAKSTVVKGRMH